MIQIPLNAQIVQQVLNVAIHQKPLLNVLMGLIVLSEAVNVFNVQLVKGIDYCFSTLVFLYENVIFRVMIDSKISFVFLNF